MTAPAALLGPADIGGMFERYARDLLRYATQRVGEHMAEDIVAQTFLAAYEQRHRYDPARGDLLPWLYGICTNLLRRHKRTELRRLRAMAALRPSTVDGPNPDRIDAQRSVAGIANALARLPRRQREVLLLYAIAELEYAEIAIALNIRSDPFAPLCTGPGRRSGPLLRRWETSNDRT